MTACGSSQHPDLTRLRCELLWFCNDRFSSTFIIFGQIDLVYEIENSAEADLVASIHAPWQATVGEYLDRWSGLDADARSHSYLVLRGDAGARRTLNAFAIAELAELSKTQNQHRF